MKGKRLLGLAMVTAFLLAVSPVANATNNATDATQPSSKSVSIDSKLSITKFSDGRVAPVLNAAKLSDTQVDNVLLQMNVSAEEIKTYPDKFKRELVSRGGVKVDLSTTMQQQYTSLDGKTYLLTDENVKEIDAIKEKDAQQINNASRTMQTQGMGGATSEGGKFIGGAACFFLGKTSTGAEYKYDYYTTYDWYPFANNGSGLNFYWWDTVAQAWQYHTTSVSHNGANNIQLYSTNPSYTQTPFTANHFHLSIGGTSADYDLFGSGYHEWGALHDEVRIPTTQKGTTGSFVSSYAHPYTAGIASAILNYLSISWSGLSGDSWNWTNTFTISNT